MSTDIKMKFPAGEYQKSSEVHSLILCLKFVGQMLGQCMASITIILYKQLHQLTECRHFLLT